MLKVTDICSTDPNDPTHCATPADIKVIRSKVAVMEHLTGPPIESIPELKGDQFPQKTWWFFAKCWADVCTAFSIFALTNPKPLITLRPLPLTPKNQLTPQFSTGHRASLNPPIKAHKQTIGSQLPPSPTTFSGLKAKYKNNTKTIKSPTREKAGQPILWAHTRRQETQPLLHLLPTGYREQNPNGNRLRGGKGGGRVRKHKLRMRRRL